MAQSSLISRYLEKGNIVGDIPNTAKPAIEESLSDPFIYLPAGARLRSFPGSL